MYGKAYLCKAEVIAGLQAWANRGNGDRVNICVAKIFKN
ncbi:hypothetical protein SD15574_0498 [Shigella dysenteriae 155-74]|nr:hypothetical protein SGB_01058 [Shigella boydii ATCC 9905]EGJ03138.1 hypothetical protein SD15574_0498 [Shigella dysenteriae 155-74]